VRWKKKKYVNLNVIQNGAYQPLGQVGPVRMLQIYDPCNLMSNPSWIKFLETKRNKISKKVKINNVLKSGEWLKIQGVKIQRVDFVVE